MGKKTCPSQDSLWPLNRVHLSKSLAIPSNLFFIHYTRKPHSHEFSKQTDHNHDITADLSETQLSCQPVVVQRGSTCSRYYYYSWICKLSMLCPRKDPGESDKHSKLWIAIAKLVWGRNFQTIVLQWWILQEILSFSILNCQLAGFRFANCLTVVSQEVLETRYMCVWGKANESIGDSVNFMSRKTVICSEANEVNDAITGIIVRV